MRYAILRKRTRLQLDINATETNISEKQHFTVTAGTLVKCISPFEGQCETNNASNTAQVQIFDEVIREVVKNKVYISPHSSILPVHRDVWPYLLSIPETDRRLNLLLNDDQRSRVFYLNPCDAVCVSGSLFGETGKSYNCIVRYIGPVPEMHHVGYFFGLEILNTQDSISPQSLEIPFARRYIECDPNEAIFTTADWITPSSLGDEHDHNNTESNGFSLYNVLNEALGNIRSMIF